MKGAGNSPRPPRSTIKKPMKTYSLSNEEKSNLQFRKAVGEYIDGLVKNDVQLYLEFNVKKRLGLNPEDKITEIDFESGEVRVEAESDKITLPTDAQIKSISKPPKGD